MKFTKGRKPDPIINVINMVDVFLTLLIFFMMTTTFTTSYGIKIHLPKSGVRSVILSKKPVTIYITKTGGIFYKSKRLTLKYLNLMLKSFKKKGMNPTIIIKADKRSTAADIVNVMGSAIENGLYKIAITTKK